MDEEDISPENFKKRLAFAVRSIQWSYAIFWSISTTNPGTMEWGDGYYNGDIKTRKTIQSIELNEDELGLQRSEQLRELFESLSAGEVNPQARRPSAALSPEDLTDTEWYYLVCMSFVFNIGKGLPGRTLAGGRPIWLCNAHFADSKEFTRSLLAKSASIQTVVCFPFLGGVVELGVTELVMEDPSLIEHVKTSFLEIPYPFSNDEQLGAAYDDDIIIGCENLDVVSPNDSSNIQPAEQDSFMVEVEGINAGTSQLQTWKLMDDDFSNCIHQSFNSSDCISQIVTDPVKVDPLNEHFLQDVEDCNQTKLTALDLRTDDLHYQSVLTSLFKTSPSLALGSHFRNRNKSSSSSSGFVAWKPVALLHHQKLKCKTSQKVLKKVLFDVPKLHLKGFLESPGEKSVSVGVYRPEADDIGANHATNRNEKLHERFNILKSMVPSANKVDKVSILDETIEYVQELQRRVQELESCKDPREVEGRTRGRPQDAVERTCDNYGSCKTGHKKKALMMNKRKASEFDEMEEEIEFSITKEGSAEISVTVNDKDVIIEMKCPWKEGLLVEIMDAVSYLHLDSHSVQSSTIDGTLSLTIKSKKGVRSVSAGAIKQALQRVAWKS
ncbi:transcription factor GLABRA 3-like [Euphorbia lathyris]|uniref:transcription factor GLABRA 3-like n=1 Tax=Euphorbia lathyris TaxID=212925 RepID=UPI003313528F